MKLIEKIIITIKEENKIVKNENKLKDFLGEEFIGYKGRDAIDKLMKEKRGHIKDVFYRKEIGNISLVWGNEKYGGLCHIVERRKQTKQPLKKLLDSLRDVIENGSIEFDAEDNRFILKYKHKVAIINLNYYKNDFKFLLTSYYEYGQYGNKKI